MSKRLSTSVATITFLLVASIVVFTSVGVSSAASSDEPPVAPTTTTTLTPDGNPWHG